MGAQIKIKNSHIEAGEPVADIVVSSSKLKGIDVPAQRAPSMIDEYPILAIAAATATGKTKMRGLAELRVKESDRFSAIVEGLGACGISVKIDGNDLTVTGAPGQIRGGTTIKSRMDHRIAMSFLILGLASMNPIAIDDSSHISTSFPTFVSLINELGAKIRKTG